MLKKLVFAFLLVISLTTFAYAQSNEISSYQANSYVGQTKTVCGTISGTKLTAKAFFINLDGQYPNQKFTNVIFKNNLSAFNVNDFTIGKKLCTTGEIKTYQGKPEIILNSPAQIK